MTVFALGYIVIGALLVCVSAAGVAAEIRLRDGRVDPIFFLIAAVSVLLMWPLVFFAGRKA